MMALVLGATGLFLYVLLRADLDHTLDQGLRARADDVSALVQQSDTGLKDAASGSPGKVGTGFAQILSVRGRVFDATAGLERRPLLNTDQLRRASRRPTSFQRVETPSLEGSARMLAIPIRAQDRKLVVVVGAALKDRDRALTDLGTLLLIGGPLALFLAAVAGYGLATAALRPVESMRARAAAISTDDLHQRLPLSRSRDELHRLGRTLNDMLARLESGVARERAFVADASHELRTPLTMLRTELELIGRDRPEGTALDGAVASAIAETDRLTRLTEGLLVLARADRDNLPVYPETIPVRDLLVEVAGRYADTADRNVQVTDPRPPELPVGGDRTRLHQALTNLVDNALRYGDGRVQLSARQRDGFIELHVTDEGSGFQSGSLATAFERFTRADHGRTEDGTGLGLAIVAAIAESHGGGAHAANLPEGGADVWLEIPCVAPTPTGRCEAGNH